MPTLAEIYRTLQDHEAAEKTASVKKQAIASPQGGGQPGIAATLEDVLGSNVAETKVRIKKKLEEASGAQSAAEGLGAHPEEAPTQVQAPVQGDKMPPGGEKGVQVTTGLSGKLSAAAKAEAEKKAETEKSAEEKLAEEYFAAGQIQAQGFVYELNRLMGGEAK
jgi:hypothetical protein